MYTIIFYSVLTSIGILGLGNYLWTRIKNESHAFADHHDFTENFYLDLGASWLIGYFCYEGLFNILSITHLFYPTTITILGAILTGIGYLWIFKSRKSLAQSFQKSSQPYWHIGVLILMQGFLLFWNLYPAFDVDSLAFYFNVVQNLLLHGGREFSAFTDIRQTVPVGENTLFALGFAIAPHSTLFTQIIHGISKVMMVFGVYGAARAFGAGIFSLAAAAFIVSEEHLLASGANASVRINMILTMSVFFIGFGLFTFARTHKKEYLYLALIAVFDILTCKYVGVNYLICFLLTTVAWLIFHPQLRESFQFSLKKQRFTIYALATMGMFALIPYAYNLVATGTPFFPATFGPLSSPYYDTVAGELARDWHYHLSLPDAIKNVSVFMVWPGVLAAKILLPLALMSCLFAFLAKKKEERLFSDGMVFFAMSLLIVILTETYVVFEMRYYRYGIGIYALASTFLLCFLTRSLLQSDVLKKFEKLVCGGLVILICLYCVKYSFDVMGHGRPKAKEIVAFLSGQTSEAQIIKERYDHADTLFAKLQALSPDPKHTAFLLTFDWPQTFYPVAGKNIAYINTGGFHSKVYFNEGLFAQRLIDENITFVFNELAVDNNYPFPGGAAYNVFIQCGQANLNSTQSLITLSRPCLEKLAQHKDTNDAQQRLDKALATVRALPKYDPFNIPTYGGPSNVIK